MSELGERIRSLRSDAQDGLGRADRFQVLNEVARYSLDSDLGVTDRRPFAYDFDETIRDRLIAHSRQDSALAALIAEDARKESRSAKRFSLLAVVLLAVLLWKVW